MAEGDCVLSEISPHGNVEAYVEQDERVAFFYLRALGDNPFGFKSCWIRNLAPAPQELDRAAMRDGRAPMLPARYCRDVAGSAALKLENLRIVWLEEGNAAALLEHDETVAIIPGWSGENGF